MTYEACKSWVDKHLQDLTREYGVPHWRFNVVYERLPVDEDTGWQVHATCRATSLYERATITIDFDVVEDESQLENHIRHELCHVVHSPTAEFFDILWPFVSAAGKEAETSMQNAYTVLIERLVRNLERMSYGHKNPGSGFSEPEQFPQPEFVYKNNDHEDCLAQAEPEQHEPRDKHERTPLVYEVQVMHANGSTVGKSGDVDTLFPHMVITVQGDWGPGIRGAFEFLKAAIQDEYLELKDDCA